MVEERDSSDKEKSLTIGEVLLSADWKVVVGLAFAQAWITVRWFCLSGISFASDDIAVSLMSSSCLVATIVLLICALFAVRLDSLALTPHWAVFVGAICLAAALYVPTHGLSGAGTEAWALGGGVVTGVGSSLLILSWFAVCAKEGNVANLSLGFLLAAALICVSVVVDEILPPSMVFDMAFSAAPVLCSSVLLTVKCLGVNVHGGDDIPTVDPGVSDRVFRYFAKTCLGALLVGLANELIRFVSPYGPVLFSTTDSFYWVSVIVLVAVNLGIAKQLASGKPSSFYFVCRGAMVLSIAGALLYPYAENANALMMSISTAGRQCVQILVWIIVLQICLKYRQSVVKLFGGMCGVWYLGSFLGMLVYRFVGRGPSIGEPFGVEAVSVVAVLLLVLAFGLVFSEKDSAFVFEKRDLPKRRAKAFTRACERLIEQGRLTKREGDVLRLLAKGASVSHIEERLYISSSTVSTHMKHIYQKLDVHSRGELFDLVERTTALCASEAVEDDGERN